MLALVIIAGLGLVACLDAKVTAVDDSGQMSANQAVGYLRTIGSAEATYKSKYGIYGSLQEIVNAQYLGLSGGSMKDDNSGLVKGYRVSIVPSADGQHFHASIILQSACDGALFTDDNFVIFQGKPIGGCQGSQK